MIKKIAVLIITVFCMVGCSITQSSTTTICDQIPEGQSSVICAAADELGVTVEETAKLLKLANSGLIISDKASAKEVLSFIVDTKQLLNSLSNGLTLKEVLSYTEWGYDSLSLESQVLVSIIDPFVGVEINVSEYLSDFDIYLLLSHLDDQEDMVMELIVFEDEGVK